MTAQACRLILNMQRLRIGSSGGCESELELTVIDDSIQTMEIDIDSVIALAGDFP